MDYPFLRYDLFCTTNHFWLFQVVFAWKLPQMVVCLWNFTCLLLVLIQVFQINILQKGLSRVYLHVIPFANLKRKMVHICNIFQNSLSLSLILYYSLSYFVQLNVNSTLHYLTLHFVPKWPYLIISNLIFIMTY